MPTCYRHPSVETGVSCSSCGRPICPDCMTQTPVGFRCPECSRERTVVKSGPAAVGGTGNYPATLVLIGANVIAFLLTIATGSGGLSSVGGPMIGDFGLIGQSVADGEWYRLITGGFLHAGLLHIAFNMFALYFLGRILEPSVGTLRFVMIYFACLLAGSFGAILLSGSHVVTVGASGAVFGIFGAVFVIARGRGLTDMAREVGIILGINLLLTFTISGISIGGHLGGVIGGVICGALVIAGERGRLGASAKAIEYGGIAAVGIVSAVAAIVISEPPTTTRVIFALLGL
ncbi:MAG: rhomboid family intramembrane serine protease [Solirubrobacterales bacterium]